MRPIQWHLKNNWRVPESLEKVIPVSKSLQPHLRWWLEESNVLLGQPLHPLKHALQIFTDASKEGWGAHLDEHTARGQWSLPESKLHINHLELKAVFLEFQTLVFNKTVLVTLRATNMRPIQWHLKNNWRVPESLEKVIPVSKSLQPHLRWWLEESNVLLGQPLHPLKHALQIFTDASKEGWGAHLDEHTARGQWSLPESKLHINHLELKAVFLEFQTLVFNKTVLVATDNTTVVAFFTLSGIRGAGEQGKVRAGSQTGLQLRRLPVRPERGQGQTNRRTLAGLDTQD